MRTEDMEGKLRAQIAQNDELTARLTQATNELDSLHTQHQDVLSHIDLFKQKTEDDTEILGRQQTYLELVANVLNECVSTINVFTQHFDHTSDQPSLLRTNVSPKFRDLMLLQLKLGPAQDPAGLEDLAKRISACLRGSFDEVEEDVKTAVGLRGELQLMTQKLANAERKCDGLQQDQALVREKERYLKNEVEAAREQQRLIEKEKELWYKRYLFRCTPR